MSYALEMAARGDLILVRRAGTIEYDIFVVHGGATSTSDGFARVHGLAIHAIFDFRDEKSDFVDWFRQVPNPQYAIEGFREELLEPMLALADRIPMKLSELKVVEDDYVVVRPSDGAIRKHLLSHCPFPCTQGTIMKSPVLDMHFRKAHIDASYIIKQNWPDLLVDYPSLLDVLIDDWDAYGHAPCPGCIGYELARENFELKLETFRVWSSGVNDTKLQRKFQAWDEKWKRASEQCGYLTPTDSGTLLRFPALTYDFLEKAKERVLEDKLCAICRFVPFERGDIISGLPCKHFFHRDCLRPWLEGNSDCPVCRKKIATGLLVDEGEWPRLPTESNVVG